MQRHAWFVVPILIVCYCCNSEKRVLKSPEKTQHVVTKWLKTQPFKTDTNYTTKPGDTVIQLLIAYDTTVVKDTITNTIERTVTKTKTITNNIHDTTLVKIFDNKLLNACQYNLKAVDYDLQTQKIATAKAEQKATKWQLFFWGAIVLFAIVVLVIEKIRL